MFTVNYAGKEKEFSSKDHAINWMDRLDCGSDLWLANTLLRSRVKQADGTFEVTTYNYDHLSGPAPDDFRIDDPNYDRCVRYTDWDFRG